MESASATDRRVILITGASTGIGLALAQKLYRSSEWRTVVTARSSSLQRFSHEGLRENQHFLIRPLDVTDVKAQKQLIKEIKAVWGVIDVLVNNAGISYRSVTEHLDIPAELDQFNTNYFGPMQLVRLVLPGMRERRSGHIVNISSVGGMMAMPTMGAYSASKFALEGASEALWYEMRPWGINVSLVEPGFIHSSAFGQVRFTDRSKAASVDTHDPYYNYYLYMQDFIAKMMNRALATPNEIASKVVRLIDSNDPALRVPATVDAWFFYYFRRLLPRRMYHTLLYVFLPHIKDWVRR